MKRFRLWIACVAVILWGGASVNAQEQKPFEGEIVYETFENYSDMLKKNGGGASVYFDGAHKMRLILKGSKMHLIDETTKCHVIVDADVLDALLNGEGKKKEWFDGYVHFCDLTKTGYDFTKDGSSYLFLAPGAIKNGYGVTTPAASDYKYVETSEKEDILGKECIKYKGQLSRNYSGMQYKYGVYASVSDIPAPKVYPWAVYGLQTSNILMKWAFKLDGGQISKALTLGMAGGEISLYIEAEVTEIIPREVSDEEFVIPADYKIIKKKSTLGGALGMLKYYRGINKELKKRGIKGGERSSDAKYKTEESWDF